MNGRDLHGGIPLGAQAVQVTHIEVFPVAIVTVAEGGDGVGDATHHLKIILPNQGRELRIPYNKQALRRLGRDAQQAGGVAMPPTEQQEG